MRRLDKYSTLHAYSKLCLPVLVTRPALSKFQSLKIRRSGDIMLFINVDRRILMPHSCERVGRGVCICVCNTSGFINNRQFFRFLSATTTPDCLARFASQKIQMNEQKQTFTPVNLGQTNVWKLNGPSADFVYQRRHFALLLEWSISQQLTTTQMETPTSWNGPDRYRCEGRVMDNSLYVK